MARPAAAAALLALALAGAAPAALAQYQAPAVEAYVGVHGPYTVSVSGAVGGDAAGRPVALVATDESGRVVMARTVTTDGPGGSAGWYWAYFDLPPDAHGTITITASAETPRGRYYGSASVQSPWPAPEAAAAQGAPAAGAPGGGCLVAAAAYGTELARHAQALRELRDSAAQSGPGAAAAHALHAAYYAASPHAADLVRERPALLAAAAAALRPPLEALSALAGAAGPRGG